MITKEIVLLFMICCIWTKTMVESGYLPSKDNCLLICCTTKGLPQKCLDQHMDSRSVAPHNSSHVEVTLILTKECQFYHGIVEECKSDCMEGADCQWSDFGRWTECSTSCGGGERVRTRTEMPKAYHGGKECNKEDAVQKESCNTHKCADGGHEKCIMECCMTHGFPLRCLEEQTKSEASHNASHVVVKTVITNDCHKYKSILEDCKEECVEGSQTTETPGKGSCTCGPWSDSGACVGTGRNTSCGLGIQTKTRICIDGEKEKCTLSDKEQKISCSLPECQKVLGKWGGKGDCESIEKDKKCGQGEKSQTRSCIDGTYDKCKDTDTVRKIPCPLEDCDKQFGQWSDVGKCESSGKNKHCGSGKQQQERTCIDGTADKCTDADKKRTVPCPLPNCPIQRGGWETDGKCKSVEKGKNCGPGYRQEIRICKDGTVDKCTMNDTKRTIKCELPPCPVDCKWSRYSAWTSCSLTCGSGVKTSTRTKVQPAMHGGKECTGGSVRSEKCATGPCAADCQWDAWGKCSNLNCKGDGTSPSMGTGEKRRNIKNRAQPGGKDCKGAQSKKCKGPCPVHCQLEPWGEWECTNIDKSCGACTRTRHVKVGALHGGDSCEKRFGNGYDKETKDVKCLVDCKISTSWSQWEACSVTCGSGTKSRNREILISPEGGGASCPSTTDTTRCDTRKPCDIIRIDPTAPPPTPDGCIIKCCEDHELPMDCLMQKFESKTSSKHNSTHMVITSVLSKSCSKYGTIMELCKKECFEEPWKYRKGNEGKIGPNVVILDNDKDKENEETGIIDNNENGTPGTGRWVDSEMEGACRNDNHKYNDIFKSDDVRTLGECKEQCDRSPGCGAVSWNDEKKLCRGTSHAAYSTSETAWKCYKKEN